MYKEIAKFFAKGLSSGFGGNSQMSKIDRAGFEGDASDLRQDGEIYHDEWFAQRAGGGQELISVNGVSYTRVYAGGTIPEASLEKLGLNGKDVMKYLKKQIIESGEKIRFDTNFSNEEGHWKYDYEVLKKNEEIPLILGKEIIMYKGNFVFEHDFIISPVD